MPVKISLSSIFSKAARTRTPVYLLSAVAIIGIAAWARGASSATAAVSATESAIAPALRLAAGTLKLEGTGQAIDAASAAKLLPLWQLLAQLESSSAAAPQEISTVIDEIQLNMSASQMNAINAMTFTDGQLGNTASASSVKASGTQAASAASGPVAGAGMFAGGGPMDGGPMPGGSRSSATGGSTASSSSASPSVIEQVIQLLEKKVQG